MAAMSKRPLRIAKISAVFPTFKKGEKSEREGVFCGQH
jgi:hypothetical protein